jgi:hypothetical protein
LSLDSTLVTPTNVTISLPSVSGLNDLLQYKNTLLDSNWTSIVPAVIGNGTNILLPDTNGVVLPSRFYRVLVN